MYYCIIYLALDSSYYDNYYIVTIIRSRLNYDRKLWHTLYRKN